MASDNGDHRREIYNYPGNARSRVWKYFGFQKKKEGPPIKENLDMSVAICRLCNKTYANKGNTTNLQFHLDHYHKDLNTECYGEVKDKGLQTKQPRIDLKLNEIQTLTGRLTKSKVDDVNDALLRMLVSKVLPISLVENEDFQRFCGLLEPRYTLPSRQYVTDSLKKKHTEMKAKLKAELSSAGSEISITHDGWTSMATESYDTVTAHFINRDWELKSAVLHTLKVTGSHTGEKIAEGLTGTKQEWNLPNITAVSDNAANEKKAFELLNWTRFGCYGHRLNLIVKHSLEVNEVSRLLGKGRKLVTLFHQSTSLNDKLMEKQPLIFDTSPGNIGHKLIMDVPTRWNSSLAMLQRLSEQTPAIVALANDLTLTKQSVSAIKTFCYSFEEQSVVESLIDVLRPFERATSILCADKSPTMQKVLPTISKVKSCLDHVPNTSSMGNVIAKMKDELNKRASVEEASLIAAALNPDTKDLSFLSSADRQNAYDLLLKLAMDTLPVTHVGVSIKKEPATGDQPRLPDLPQLPPLLVDPLTVTEDLSSEDKKAETEVSVGPPSKKIKCTDMEEWFDDVCFTGESRRPVKTVVEQEIERYLTAKRHISETQLSLLQWWKANEHIYPRLSVLARQYLAIPASSVPSERVFSLAGSIVNKKRSRLKPALVDTLIFLKMNMKEYW